MAETAERSLDPHKSPSYPNRVHLHERPQLDAQLKSCNERLAQARQELEARMQGPGREAALRLFSQLVGARDQLADAVRRLPMEVGKMYDEDRLRLVDALAAFDRVLDAWNGQ